ncbi:Rieske (2Fe-2S) protein [Streptomyces sp. HUAS MG47]|uniref:Rieske (2Fe-2S) protein n=1 Tax=Streptomyces solicamelliae TaxID=3231716 RepID=UPI0038781E8A
MSGVARRTVVAAAGGAGLVGVLAGCGGSGDSGYGTSGSASGTSGAAGNDAPKGGGGGAVLAKTSDIPQGGGKVFADQGVVVTQPVAGEFKAFSSSCTHSGCAVKDVVDGTITCPCHGSAFSAADGSVKQGPATRPLPAAQITVDGDSITLA